MVGTTLWVDPLEKKNGTRFLILYDTILEARGSVSVRQLEEVARVSGLSAETSIHYYEIGLIVPPTFVEVMTVLV